ncbi:MAG: hypothetical protein NXH86_04270 [Flavobacteriaceae bacterium]|nr:hypothetical protein [Flavobacteriaceae bacterium]
METIKKEFKGTKDWEVSKHENDSSGRSCYRIDESKGRATIEELEANAKLIEAAPELLYELFDEVDFLKGLLGDIANKLPKAVESTIRVRINFLIQAIEKAL